MSLKSGAKRSLEDDRDTSHRTDSHPSPRSGPSWKGNQAADFELTDRASAYALVRRTLVRFEYHGLRKPDKGLLKRYLEKVTGLSRAQVTRLIRQHRERRKRWSARRKAAVVLRLLRGEDFGEVSLGRALAAAPPEVGRSESRAVHRTLPDANLRIRFWTTLV